METCNALGDFLRRWFYYPQEVSPSRQSYHWPHNAEIYFLIDKGAGKVMLLLLDH